MSFHLAAYKAVDPNTFNGKLPIPAVNLPAFGAPESLNLDSGNRLARDIPMEDPEPVLNQDEELPQFPADHLLAQRYAKMYCSKPCMDCTDPKGGDWIDGVHWRHLKLELGQDRYIDGRWIPRKYAAGTRYYFLVSRSEYETGLQLCKDMGFPYVQPAMNDARWHPFAIEDGEGNEQLMPGCSVYYPSLILTCSNELGCGL